MPFVIRATKFPNGKVEPRGDFLQEDHPVYGWVTHPVRAKAFHWDDLEDAREIRNEVNAGPFERYGVKIYQVFEVAGGSSE